MRKAWTELIENCRTSVISETREIRSSLFPGVHYPVSRQKPMCNLYLYRGVVQKRALVFTQEVHKAPDPCGNIIQLTLQQLNNHPIEAYHCMNTVKFPLLNVEEGINTSKWEKSSCTLRCTEPAFWLCSLHKLCSKMCPAHDLLCGRGMWWIAVSLSYVGREWSPRPAALWEVRQDETSLPTLSRAPFAKRGQQGGRAHILHRAPEVQ